MSFPIALLTDCLLSQVTSLSAERRVLVAELLGALLGAPPPYGPPLHGAPSPSGNGLFKAYTAGDATPAGAQRKSGPLVDVSTQVTMVIHIKKWHCGRRWAWHWVKRCLKK